MAYKMVAQNCKFQYIHKISYMLIYFYVKINQMDCQMIIHFNCVYKMLRRSEGDLRNSSWPPKLQISIYTKNHLYDYIF